MFQNKKNIFLYKRKELTGISFMDHVKLATGFELSLEQFPLILSPIRYLVCIPVIIGRCSGISV